MGWCLTQFLGVSLEKRRFFIGKKVLALSQLMLTLIGFFTKSDWQGKWSEIMHNFLVTSSIAFLWNSFKFKKWSFAFWRKSPFVADGFGELWAKFGCKVTEVGQCESTLKTGSRLLFVVRERKIFDKGKPCVRAVFFFLLYIHKKMWWKAVIIFMRTNFFYFLKPNISFLN